VVGGEVDGASEELEVDEGDDEDGERDDEE
jgi:hypothetical protein